MHDAILHCRILCLITEGLQHKFSTKAVFVKRHDFARSAIEVEVWSKSFHELLPSELVVGGFRKNAPPKMHNVPQLCRGTLLRICQPIFGRSLSQSVFI